MKAKHVFTTLGLAFAMGIGVASAAIISANRGIQPAKAGNPVTLYLDVSNLTWWSGDGAEVRAHCWGGAAESTAWPGAQMTAVTGASNLFELEIDDGYTSVIFTRVNPADHSTVWNRSSKDGGTAITLPTNYSVQNTWVLEHDGSDYNDGNYTGHWDLFDPTNKHTVNTVLDKWGTETINGSVEVVDGDGVPAPAYDFGYSFSGWFSDDQYTEGNEVTAVTADMTVYGKITRVPTKDFSLDASLAADFSGKPGVAIYAWEPSGKTNSEWPGVSTPIWAESITLPEDASFVVCNGTDTSAADFTQTVDVSFAPAIDGDTLILLDTKTDGKVDTAWESEGVVTNNFTVKCGANTYSFALADTDKPEGVEHQFKATISNAYRADVLTFYQNGALIDTLLGVDYDNGQPVAGNNIVGSLEDGFRVYHRKASMEIYLKTYSDGGRSLWGTGYEEEEFRLYANGTPTTIVYLPLDTEFTPSGDYIKQYKSTAKVDLQTGNYWNIAEIGGQVQRIGFETGDNNAKQAEGSPQNFTVYNNCNETIYVKMKADLSLTLWIGGRQHARILTIDGANYALEAYQEEGQPLQYRVTGVNLIATQQISYSFDGEPVEITAKGVGNNNLTSSLAVLADATNADIYLDPVNNTLWVGGLGEAGGFDLLITNSTSGKVTFLAMTQNPNNPSEYFSASHAFLAGDTIKILNCTGGNDGTALPSAYTPADGLNTYSNSNFRLNQAGDVVCSANVTVNAYIQLEFEHDKLYFGDVAAEVAEAIDFAGIFASHLTNACSQEDKQENVEFAWANDIMTAYNALSNEAKAVLAEGPESEHADIREFAERYMAFKTKAPYSTWNLENFMGWDIPTSSNQVSIANMNNSAIIVFAVSAVIIASTAGLFFIIRRKKFEK